MNDGALRVDHVPAEFGAGARRRFVRVLAWSRRPIWLRLVSIGVVVALWQIIGVHYPYATSSPGAILRAAADGHTFRHATVPAFEYTLTTFGIGYGISVVGGLVLGLAMYRFRLLDLMLHPYVLAIYSTTWIAFFPLLLIAFGTSTWLRVGVVVIGGIFPIIVNTYLGAREVDPDLLAVGTSFSARPRQKLWTITLPATMPYIFSGFRIGFARGMIGAVVIELEASAVGVGRLLGNYSQYLELDRFFVDLILLGLFSLACAYLLKRIEYWFTEPWSRRGRLRRRRGDPFHEGRVDALVASARSALAPARRAIESAERGAEAITARVSPFLRTNRGAWLVRIVTLVLFVAVWQLWANRVGSSAVLPKPSSIVVAAYHHMFTTGDIWGAIGTSFEAMVIAFAIAVVAGAVIGVLMGRSRLAEGVLDPYVSFLYALPHVTFIPLMIVWLGFGIQFRIAYGVVSAIFAMILTTMNGVKYMDPELLAVGKAFCAGRRRTLTSIVLPASTPAMVAGARNAFSQSWHAIIIAEILSTQTGLGGEVTYYSNYFLGADMVVAILFIMIIAVALLQLASWAQPRLTPWANSSRTR